MWKCLKNNSVWTKLSKLLKSDNAKYVYASAAYILISGTLFNCFAMTCFNSKFDYVSVLGYGYVLFFIRYELVELVRDIKRRR